MSDKDIELKEAIYNSLKAEFYKEQRDESTKFYEFQAKREAQQIKEQSARFRWLVGFVIGIVSLGLAIMKNM